VTTVAGEMSMSMATEEEEDETPAPPGDPNGTGTGVETGGLEFGNNGETENAAYRQLWMPTQLLSAAFAFIATLWLLA